MDMIEYPEDTSRALRERKLGFTLVESGMFSSFDGTWTMKCHSRVKEFDTKSNQFVYRYKTQLTYSVFVKPKGPVPVIALEWRIREDIPINLEAVKIAAERLSRQRRDRDGRNDKIDTDTIKESLTALSRSGWGTDETLEIYIGKRRIEDDRLIEGEWMGLSLSPEGSNINKVGSVKLPSSRSSIKNKYSYKIMDNIALADSEPAVKYSKENNFIQKFNDIMDSLYSMFSQRSQYVPKPLYGK
jgi:hypothetical protein